MFLRLLAVLLALTSTTAVAESTDTTEEQFWAFASVSGSVESLEAFIDAFPESEHLDDAETMISNLEDDERRLQMEQYIFEQVGDVTYDGTIKFGNEYTIGQSLASIISSTPAFPPIEGLPDEVWKDKSCSSCHQWKREDLCAQAQTYITKRPVKYHEKQHPFGGMLKINMRNWAQGGCR